MTLLAKVENYHTLLNQVAAFLGGKQQNKPGTPSAALLQTYWSIGEYIVLSEQEGNSRATYGIRFLERMAAHLTKKFGIGFSRSNLTYMRRFFLFFPIRETVSGKLSWSHYFEILKTNDRAAVIFYINQIEKFGWSVRHLKQQIKNGLHHCVTIFSPKPPSKPKLPKRQSFMSWLLQRQKSAPSKAEKNSPKCEAVATPPLPVPRSPFAASFSPLPGLQFAVNSPSIGGCFFPRNVRPHWRRFEVEPVRLPTCANEI
jgi:hypothetical protein